MSSGVSGCNDLSHGYMYQSSTYTSIQVHRLVVGIELDTISNTTVIPSTPSRLRNGRPAFRWSLPWKPHSSPAERWRLSRRTPASWRRRGRWFLLFLLFLFCFSCNCIYFLCFKVWRSRSKQNSLLASPLLAKAIYCMHILYANELTEEVRRYVKNTAVGRQL